MAVCPHSYSDTLVLLLCSRLAGTELLEDELLGGTSGSVCIILMKQPDSRCGNEPIALFLRGHRQDLGVGCDCSPSPQGLPILGQLLPFYFPRHLRFVQKFQLLESTLAGAIFHLDFHERMTHA